VQDATAVELGQHLGHPGTQAHVVAFEERPFPQGVVEVPDQELDRSGLTVGGGALSDCSAHGDSVSVSSEIVKRAVRDGDLLDL
jgi:hypothetical protein